MRSHNLDLESSLERTRARLASSIVLTPVDSISLATATQTDPAFLQGLYVSDKLRDEEAKINARILFPGREDITRDITRIHQELASRLGANAASLRLLSGLHAHTVLFMGLANIGDTVLLIPEVAGGHFATTRILERLGLNVIPAPVDFKRMMIDRKATLEMIRIRQPEFIFVDRSEGLKYEDFGYLGQHKLTTGIFDSSQYLPQIMFGHYANPFDWGFDLQMFTLHKSFPGAQKAGIAARELSGVWQQALRATGEFVSSSHVENTYRVGLALADSSRMKEYQSRLIPLAAALEQALAAEGINVVPAQSQGDPLWPRTHHLWVKCSDSRSALAASQNLAAINIYTNYRVLPYKLGHGLRLGVNTAALCGIGVDNVSQIAVIIAKCIANGPSDSLKNQVAEIAHRCSGTAIAHWT